MYFSILHRRLCIYHISFITLVQVYVFEINCNFVYNFRYCKLAGYCVIELEHGVYHHFTVRQLIFLICLNCGKCVSFSLLPRTTVIIYTVEIILCICCRYTMTKTTVIIFILLFSIIFKLEKAVSLISHHKLFINVKPVCFEPCMHYKCVKYGCIMSVVLLVVILQKCSLVLVVLLISGGLFMFTYESTQFNMLGFLLVLTASVLSGVRWTLSQMVLQRNDLGKQFFMNVVTDFFTCNTMTWVRMLPPANSRVEINLSLLSLYLIKVLTCMSLCVLVKFVMTTNPLDMMYHMLQVCATRST